MLIKHVFYFMIGTLRMTRKVRGIIYTPTLTQFDITPGYRLYVTLAIWTEICNLPFSEIVRLKSAEAVELYFQYIRRFDSWVDTPSGMSAFVNDPLQAKTRPELKVLTTALADWICKAGLEQIVKREILALIRMFRTRAIFGATYDSMTRQLEGKQTPEALISVIEETSGLMYWVFAAILNQIHQVPDDL